MPDSFTSWEDVNEDLLNRTLEEFSKKEFGELSWNYQLLRQKLTWVEYGLAIEAMCWEIWEIC